ncbi:MAG TPA: hypothetical protein VEB19_05345 [Gemmatimonadaceae bacterium]|nr:hypothetical protein [Gemmatimonadaceae bacterium]
MHRLSVVALASIIAMGGCSDDPVTGPGGDLITLSASQAASLVARVESFAVSDPTIGSISDTIEVVVKAGAEARRIEVTTDLGATEYYAVSLHMPNAQSVPASATFHFIAFDDPNNPTRFIILGGWSALGTGSDAPTVVSGPIGGATSTSLTGHLFSISGSQVSAWHASAGTVSFESSANGGACTGFTGPGTCVKGSMDVTFNLTSTVAGNGAAGERTASGSAVNVPGIRLTN